MCGFINLSAQSYDVKKKYVDYGTLKYEISTYNVLSISSYVTKQKILTHANQEQRQKMVSDLPKYRYELVLVSKSKHNGNPVETWLFDAKVFIDSTEVTKEQFPEGFSAIVKTVPTVIYWYETSNDTLNIKITWGNLMYNENKY